MNDFKSKLPDLQELTRFTGKFIKDVKDSVCEIVDEYKKKRAVDNADTVGDVTSSSDPVAPPTNPVPPVSPIQPEDSPTKKDKEDTI